MKQHTLFTMTSSFIEPELLKTYLSSAYKQTIETIVLALKQQLGNIKAFHLHPYRISRVNYLKARIEGDLGQFYLVIELSGYTEFPDLPESLSRLHINLNDATDAYWFMQYLKQELCVA